MSSEYFFDKFVYDFDWLFSILIVRASISAVIVSTRRSQNDIIVIRRSVVAGVYSAHRAFLPTVSYFVQSGYF